MCIPGPEAATEINCLLAYDGRGYVKLWNHDLTDNMLLLERITPGDQMWAVTDYRERARLMARRVKDLPIPWEKRSQYPTYGTWMDKNHKKLTDMGGMEEPLFYLEEAMKVYGGLKQKYNRRCLLHGDLHQENMLLNQQGGYTIIDPKGVADDPVMETARFLLNETPCEEEKILEMVSIMAPVVGIPEQDMLKGFYIDTALGNCWTMEEHFPTRKALLKQKQEALNNCKFAYGLLNGCQS
jgi:streptomycin 6-kinase